MVNNNNEDESRMSRSNTANEPAGKGRGTYSRRRFVTKVGNKHIKMGKHIGLEAVDDALNEDATTIEVMRREVLDSQKMELAQARAELSQLRRTHDRLKDETTAKQKLVQELTRQLEELRRMSNPENFQSAPGETQTALHVQKIEAQVQENHSKVQAAIIQKQSLHHMIRRLTDEILSIKKSTKKLQQQMRSVDNELSSSTLHYQHAKQELKNEERKLDSLKNKVDARKKQQEDRMQGLERIMEERSIIMERQEERLKKRDEIIARSAGEIMEDEEERLKRAYVVRNVYSTVLEERVTQHRDELTKLENTFQQIKNVTGLSDVDEIVEKFLSRSEKNAQLEALAEEIRGRIDGLKTGNQQLKQRLADLASAAEGSAGNREVYQEVDLIDEALASARKHCEEARDRANRLHVTLDSLRDALVRFVRKVDSLPTAGPSVGIGAGGSTTKPGTAGMGSANATGVLTSMNNTPRVPSAGLGMRAGSAGRTVGDASSLSLPDLVTLLDTKISQVMKAVNAALIKEDRGQSSMPTSVSPSRRGSREDLNGADSTKELSFSKLDTTNISKLLYHSLMTAEPDTSERNLRATRRASQVNEIDTKLLHVPEDAQEISTEDEDDLRAPETVKEDDFKDPTLDREMIKKVSSMILGRDQGGKKKKKHRGRNRSSSKNSKR
mmetsp:Transcript_12778/g.16472  ORF Transcript_12778/g.16472 Transcript_12778/m.16472 type:complete len:669 (-) Transcript_12778:230-2236(-)